MKYDKNKTHYITVTGIIVNSPGKYLITKRADWEKAFPGRWTIPGGKVEVLDYMLREKDTQHHWYNVLEEILKKEVFEETGLRIKGIGYVTSLVYVRDDQIPCMIISLYAYPKKQEEENSKDNEKIKLDKSLTKYAWVTLQEAKNYDLIEGIYEELEMLDKRLKTGKSEEWRKES